MLILNLREEYTAGDLRRMQSTKEYAVILILTESCSDHRATAIVYYYYYYTE